MKAIGAIGTIDQGRRVLLDEPLPAGVSGRVRLLILIVEDEPNERDMLRGVAQGGSFDFLNALEEDVPTFEDGKPFNDPRYDRSRCLSVRRPRRPKARSAICLTDPLGTIVPPS
jgi:hypothetical protein